MGRRNQKCFFALGNSIPKPKIRLPIVPKMMEKTRAGRLAFAFKLFRPSSLVCVRGEYESCIFSNRLFVLLGLS